MADNPWAGITNLGAIDQKLYQEKKDESPTPVVVPSDKQQTQPKKTTTEKKVKKIEPAIIIEQEIRMTLPLHESTVSLLDQIERTIFIKRNIKFRSKQRITKNNVARAWLSLLNEIDVDWNNIEDDADLIMRLKKVIKK